VHGGDGLGGVSRRQGQDSRLTYPPSEPAVAGAFAPRSWLSLQPPLERRVLVTLGPLTNLAAAVLADPSFPERFDEIIALGGAVHGSGNITPFAEFNIFADPEAAAIAVRTVRNLRIIPLEICARYILTEQTLIEAARSERRVARFMRSIHEEYIAWYRDKEGIDGCYPHDSFAVLAALHPNAFRYEAVTLDVNCNAGDERYGQTRSLSSPGLPVKLCVDVDADLIASAIRDVLFGPR
jgi:inosine-uridine nucleoside N-ribohydrolase